MSNTEKLNVTTPTDREIVITRRFNAPRDLVWDAMTKPELIKRWCTGPPGWEMATCEDDSRAGGTFSSSWRGPEGAEMAMTGVYREVVPLERIVRTEKTSNARAHRPAAKPKSPQAHSGPYGWSVHAANPTGHAVRWLKPI